MTLRKVPILIILSDFIFFRSLDSAFVIHISQSRSIEMARHIEMKSEKKTIVLIKWSLFEVILWSRESTNELFANSQKPFRV